MTAQIMPLSSFQQSPTVWKFEGAQYGVELSFFLLETPPGEGPELHSHAYAELFVVHDGEVAFTVGTETIAVAGGQVVIVPPETPHAFRNTGTRALGMTSIHAAGEMRTTWLPAS